MSNKEEDKYFQKLEQERRETQRREQELEALRRTERDGIAVTLSTTEEVAQEALELGFSAETARVLPLTPLIQVAWADGSVSAAEERSVTELAEAQGITRGSPSHDFLHRLLLEQPSDLFFERVNRVIAHMIASDPNTWVKKTLPELCHEVANASGGFFGFGNRISEEEETLINELTRRFEVATTKADRLPVYEASGEGAQGTDDR